MEMQKDLNWNSLLSLSLTTEQYAIAYCDDKLISVTATPGSGKTKTLVARATRLWYETNHKILICTFSKAAANEIRERLESEFIGRVSVRTIHSLAYELVKENWEELEQFYGGKYWPSQPNLVTRLEELRLLKELFPSANEARVLEKIEVLRSYCTPPSTIVKLAKKGVLFGRYKIEDLETWAMYERERIARGLITFDDMVVLANVLIGNPLVSAQLERKYDHLLLDEAQDTSDLEWSLLRPIVTGSKTSLVVGDYNQAIYGFRQADGTVLKAFDSLMSATSFRLTQSFRIGSKVAKLANRLVRDKRSLITDNGKESKTSLHPFASVEEELNFVFSNLPSQGSVAILGRTHSYLEQFERGFIQRGIHFAGNSFYRSSHIVKMVNELEDIPELLQDQTIVTLYQDNQKFDKQQRADFERARKIIKENGFSVFKSYVSFAQMPCDTGIVVSTGHSAKGAEWDTVFIVGAQEGHIPHKYSTNIEEEHNLMYVMCTRAKKQLYVSYVGAISRFLK